MNKRLICFDYNQKSRKCDITFHQNNILKNKYLQELLISIENEIKIKNICLKRNPIIKGRLAFQKPIKTLICSVLLQKYYKNKINIKKAIKIISRKLSLNPISVASYSIRSPIPEIVKKMNKEFKMNIEMKHQITEKWLELKRNNTNLSGEDIIEEIANKKKLKPITIASYARSSEDNMIKLQAIRIYGKLQEHKHNITKEWSLIQEEKSELTPTQIIAKLSKIKNLSKSTVASIARFSNNNDIKIISNKIYLNLMCKKHNITEEWLEYDDIPYIKAYKIGSKKKLKPISVLFYAISSENFKVRFESLKAYKLHMMQDNLIFNQKIQFTDEEFIKEIKMKKDRFSNIAEMYLKEINNLKN